MLSTMCEEESYIPYNEFITKYLTTTSVPVEEIIYRMERSGLYSWKESGIPAFLQLIEFIIMRNLRKPFQTIDKQYLQIYMPSHMIKENLVSTIRKNMVYPIHSSMNTPWNVKYMINRHFLSSRSYKTLKHVYLKKINSVSACLNEILHDESRQLRNHFNQLLKELYIFEKK